MKTTKQELRLNNLNKKEDLKIKLQLLEQKEYYKLDDFILF